MGTNTANQYDVVHEMLMGLQEYDLAWEVLRAKRIKLETDFILAQDGHSSDKEVSRESTKGV